MKKRTLVAIALTVVMALSIFAGCKGNVVKLTDAPLNATNRIDFSQPVDPSVIFESDGWSNGDVFNVVWKKHNVHYENGILRLGITEEKATAWVNDEEVEYSYTAGEARTTNYYHYGDYEVSMKPSANWGTASTFFICTGPYDTKFVLDENGDYVLDENGQRVTVQNAHDEIDIEFLGKDTTHVQFNFFVDGKGGNEYLYDLGFDASKEFHRYGFRWEEDCITWYVDGEPVYKATTDKSVQPAKNVSVVEKLPSTAGRMLTNYWCGNKRAWGWMGQYKGEIYDQGTEYQWIATNAVGAPLNPEEAPNDQEEVINWTEIDPVAPTFASTELYTVTTEGNSANVTYTAVGGSDYKNVEMNISELAQAKNYVHLNVTNNGTETVNVRVNVVDQELVTAGAQNMSTNVSATMNGEAVYTDLVWGGSFFDIAPGQSAELFVKYAGQPEYLQLMIDSSKNDSAVRAGNVTINDIKFAAFGEIETPDDPVDPPVNPPVNPEDPVTPPVEDNGLQFNFWTSSSDYTATGNNIKYNGAGNSYSCSGTDIAQPAAGNDTFTVTITNHGAADSRVRIDIQATTLVGNHSACNVSATGGDVWTDHEWGGSTVTVAAGQSVTLVITYDSTTERGAVTNLVVFVDSARGDSNVYSSNVTLSNMAFSKVGTDEPVPEPDPVEPIVNISDLEAGTTTDAELIEGTGISASAGLAIDANKKSIDGFEFTLRLKLGGTMKVADGVVTAGIKVVTTGPATIVVYAMSSSSSDNTRTLQIATLVDGAFNKLGETTGIDGGAIAKYELTVDAAGTYYIGSTKSGINIYYIAVTEPKAPVPELPTDGGYVKFEGNDCYTITAEQEYSNVIHFTYEGVSTNTYQNVNTWIKDKAEGKNTFSITIRNNGTETVYITVKLETDSAVQVTENKMEIGAGEMQTLTTEFTGEAALLYLFIDTGWSQETTTHSGSVSVAGIKFTLAEKPAPELPTDGEYVKFSGNDCYTITAEQEYSNVIGVSYTSVTTNTYLNVNTWIKDKAENKTNFSITILNNGTEAVKITVKLEAAGSVALAENTVEIGAGQMQTITLNFEGEAEMLFLFIGTGWNEANIESAGNITIAGIKFA